MLRAVLADLARWESWMPPAAGLAAAGAVLLAGWRARRRRRRLPPLQRGPAESPPRGTVGDRRSALRWKGNPVEVLVRAGDGPPAGGFVIDRSRAGLGLVLLTPTAPGDRLSLRSRAAPEGSPWVDVEVMNCTPEADGYYVGCRFIRAPSWGVQLLFG